MTLTPDQVAALKGGLTVDLIEPQSNTACVLVPADVYHRAERIIVSDQFSPEERLALLAESGKRVGWNDPAMDVYDNYDANHP
jgi:hypothetical protein